MNPEFDCIYFGCVQQLRKVVCKAICEVRLGQATLASPGMADGNLLDFTFCTVCGATPPLHSSLVIFIFFS
jgi:hypothetical protein